MPSLMLPSTTSGSTWTWSVPSHQWIHVDVERAKEESPYKSTIAHGYLTLSLLPHLWDEIVEVNNLKMMVNYGMDKMRFGQPVITGSRIRMKASLANLENLRGICKAYIDFVIEIEGQRKPALKGEAQLFQVINVKYTSIRNFLAQKVCSLILNG